MIAIDVCGVEIAYDAKPAVAGAAFHIGRGEFVGLIGPNGSGKSTLVRAISRLMRVRSGHVDVLGQGVWGYRPDALARRMAVVAQHAQLHFDFTVEEVVGMGRIPHLQWYQKEGAQDADAVARALRLADCTQLASRLVTTLSGGEKQRVALARALAQEPDVLLLDEPTTHLDINFQVELLDVVRSLCDTEGLTVLAVLHDLNLAAQYCDRLIMLQSGRVYEAGPPEAVLSERSIREVYGVDVCLSKHPVTGTPCVHLLSKTRTAIAAPSDAASV